ncbi:MAG: hypothetical protein A3E87_04330 [Gammaproteobacteria bacterium RIFCSPHIGHO2_12_FULL_35_23]|nr:MAG: hypothetical protein A3E87_04330 [Gammaproteobacteria bacterium RIFCSPHIGHO2_12_FULL_35_23]
MATHFLPQVLFKSPGYLKAMAEHPMLSPHSTQTLKLLLTFMASPTGKRCLKNMETAPNNLVTTKDYSRLCELIMAECPELGAKLKRVIKALRRGDEAHATAIINPNANKLNHKTR